jgi:hypothetical protein
MDRDTAPDQSIAPAPARRRSRLGPVARFLVRTGGLTILVLAAGLAWRGVRFGMGFPLWGDEAFVAGSLMTRDFAGMAHPPLEYEQIAPLGFMWVELAVAKVAGFNDWSMRAIAFVCGTAAFLLFARFARRCTDSGSALLAIAILAASNYPVRHTAELKPYAGDMLLAVVILTLAWRASRRPESLATWAGLISAAAAGVWFSFPAVFLGSGAALFLAWQALQTRRRAMFAGTAVLGCVFAASLLAAMVLYIRPLAESSPHYFAEEGTQWVKAFPPLSKPWQLPLWLLDTHTGNMMAYPFGGKNFGSAATTLLVIVGSVGLWRKKRGDLLLLLLAPLAVALAAACLRKYPYGTSARTMLYMAPSFCLLAGMGLRAVLRRLMPARRRRRALRAAAIVLAVAALIGAGFDVARPYADPRALADRQFVRDLAGEALSADQWVVPNSIAAGQAGPLLDGRSDVVFRYYLDVLAPVPMRWGPMPQQVPLVGGRTWVLCYTDPQRDGNNPARLKWNADFCQVLAERLGPPRCEQREIDRLAEQPDGVTVMVYTFPPPKAAPPAPAPAESPGRP